MREEKRQRRLKSIKDHRDFGVNRYGADFEKIYSRYQSIRQHLKNKFGAYVDTFKTFDNDGKMELSSRYNEKFTLHNGKKLSVSSWIHHVQKLQYLMLEATVFDSWSDEEFLSLISSVSQVLSYSGTIYEQLRINTSPMNLIFTEFLHRLINLRSIVKEYY